MHWFNLFSDSRKVRLLGRHQGDVWVTVRGRERQREREREREAERQRERDWGGREREGRIRQKER